MEIKDFEEKAKKYFKEIATDERLWDIICDGCDCEDCCFNDCDLETIKRRNFSYLYTDKNVAKLEKYLEDKKMGNFKVRCVNTSSTSIYTKDKVYEVINGTFTNDRGGGVTSVKNVTDLCKNTSATWELVEGATDTNVESKDDCCVECQPNHKSCETCKYFSCKSTEQPCNDCIRHYGESERYKKGENCHRCGRTFEADDTVISPNETICKLEKEIEDLKTEKEKHTALFAKLYQEKEEQDKILKEKNEEIERTIQANEQLREESTNYFLERGCWLKKETEYIEKIEQIKSQLPKEKTIKDELDEIERDLLKVQQAVEMKEMSYNQGYKQGIEDMHKHLRQSLKLKGIK